MANRILTTHVGSLPRPAKVIELNHKRVAGEKVDEAAFDRELKTAVVDAVHRQKKAGIDLVNDGEFGHTMGWDYDYGSWWSYVVRRLNGVEVEAEAALDADIDGADQEPRWRPTISRSASGSIAGTGRSSTRPTWTRVPGARCPSSS